MKKRFGELDRGRRTAVWCMLLVMIILLVMLFIPQVNAWFGRSSESIQMAVAMGILAIIMIFNGRMFGN